MVSVTVDGDLPLGSSSALLCWCGGAAPRFPSRSRHRASILMAAPGHGDTTIAQPAATLSIRTHQSPDKYLRLINQTLLLPTIFDLALNPWHLSLVIYFWTVRSLKYFANYMTGLHPTSLHTYISSHFTQHDLYRIRWTRYNQTVKTWHNLSWIPGYKL